MQELLFHFSRIKNMQAHGIRAQRYARAITAAQTRQCERAVQELAVRLSVPEVYLEIRKFYGSFPSTGTELERSRF